MAGVRGQAEWNRRFFGRETAASLIYGAQLPSLWKSVANAFRRFTLSVSRHHIPTVSLVSSFSVHFLFLCSNLFPCSAFLLASRLSVMTHYLAIQYVQITT